MRVVGTHQPQADPRTRGTIGRAGDLADADCHKGLADHRPARLTGTTQCSFRALSDAKQSAKSEEEAMKRIFNRHPARLNGRPHDITVTSELPDATYLVDQILADAIRRGASDVHIEPTADGCE